MITTVFFLSGVAGLIYEVAWQRVLGLIFGNDILAVTIVVVSYMTGLGFGALYFGRLSDRLKNPFRLFILLELGVGMTALTLGFLLGFLPVVYHHLYWSFGGFHWIGQVLTFILSLTVLFVPTFLMGGTLPVLSRSIIHRPEEIGVRVGRLYGFNTMGGVMGAIAAGFFLIPALGLKTSVFCAVILNMTIAFCAWLIRILPAALPVASIPEQHHHPELTWPLIVALAAGFTGMIYEILWFRALSVYLTNATYSFTTVLAVYLAGFGIGSGLVSPWLMRRGLAAEHIVRLQLLISGYAIFSTIFLSRLPVLLYRMAGVLENPTIRLFLPGSVLGIVLMLVPTILMGAVFPLLVRIYALNPDGLGSEVGRLYLFNILGSMAGPLTALFFLIPLVGTVVGIVVTAFLNLLLAAYTWRAGCWVDRIRIKPYYFLAVAAILFCAALGIKSKRLLPPSIYHSVTRHDRIRFYQETPSGTVLVSEDLYTGIRACYVNNNAVCGTTYDALKVVKMLGYLPLVVKPETRDALVIGFGIGITTACLEKGGVLNIDCVEIAPAVRRAAIYFQDYNHRVFQSPRVSFIAGDGRHYLFLTKKQYDVISCDPTHPILGCGTLYTRQYFELLRQRLKPGGVACQYLPLHKVTPADFRSLVRTFASVFPRTTVWLGHSHGILMGTDQSGRVDFKRIREFLQEIGDEIIDDPYAFVMALVLDSTGAQRLGQTGRLHTDDLLFLEYFRPASLRRQNWELNLQQLIAEPADPFTLFSGIPGDTLARYQKGRQYFWSALIAQNQGDRRRFEEALMAAAKANPENREIRRFLKAGYP